MEKRIQKYLFSSLVAGLCLIFLLLSFKNPFVPNSLIGNLEPYPDTLYYATPAWNFVHEKGFTMSFDGYHVKQVTPPLYSLYLIPFFGLFQDVRAFYIANIVLLLASIVLFLLLIKKIYGKDMFGWILSAFLGFLFVTNFYIYTIPGFLLAENITIFLCLAALFLLESGITNRSLFIAGILGVLFPLIKFSNAPLGAVFYLLYAFKVMRTSRLSKQIRAKFFILTGLSVAAFLLYLLMSGILIGHKNLESNTSFGLNHFVRNVSFYLISLIGGPSQLLWFRERFISSIVGITSLLGFAMGLFSSRFRQLTVRLFLFVFSLVLFMSFFYAVDNRFILAIYPLLLVATGIFFYEVKERWNGRAALFLMILLAGVNMFLTGQGQKPDERGIITFKKQIGLNFKHKETPWYFLAVQEFNAFFSRPDKQVYLGTFLPPFYVQFYSNDNYVYLPLTRNQDFFPEKGGLAEQMGIKEIPSFYKGIISGGGSIFISNVYVNNLLQWKEDFTALQRDFIVQLVKEGCLGTCNIYRVTLRGDTNQ